MTKEVRRPYQVLMAVLLIMVTLLTACGDATATPASSANKATSTPMSNEDLAKQSGASAATTAAAGSAATTAAGSTTAVAAGNAATTVAGTPNAAGTATTPAATAAPTPTGVTSANLPTLVYPGAREVKLGNDTAKQVIDNSGNAEEDAVVGKFNPDKVLVYFSGDEVQKLEDFYKKALTDDGWQQFSRNSNGNSTLLVYQKSGTKLVLQFGVLQSSQGLPPEMAAAYKQGDKLVLLLSGSAYVPTPTPFAIPGAATLAVGPGQKKIATIEMESGDKIQIELFPDIAPKTVENFEKLANKGFYNGLTFHRIEKDPQPFVVQGGDPKGDGTGGPGYTIPDEFTTQKKHVRGTVAMAHSAAPNSAGSQFYICLGEASFLDGKYAIFGQVIGDGMTAVDKIQKGDKMKSVKVEVK